jgi:hypothetical protein
VKAEQLTPLVDAMALYGYLPDKVTYTPYLDNTPHTQVWYQFDGKRVPFYGILKRTERHKDGEESTRLIPQDDSGNPVAQKYLGLYAIYADLEDEIPHYSIVFRNDDKIDEIKTSHIIYESSLSDIKAFFTEGQLASVKGHFELQHQSLELEYVAGEIRRILRNLKSDDAELKSLYDGKRFEITFQHQKAQYGRPEIPRATLNVDITPDKSIKASFAYQDFTGNVESKSVGDLACAIYNWLSVNPWISTDICVARKFCNMSDPKEWDDVSPKTQAVSIDDVVKFIYGNREKLAGKAFTTTVTMIDGFAMPEQAVFSLYMDSDRCKWYTFHLLGDKLNVMVEGENDLKEGLWSVMALLTMATIEKKPILSEMVAEENWNKTEFFAGSNRHGVLNSVRMRPAEKFIQKVLPGFGGESFLSVAHDIFTRYGLIPRYFKDRQPYLLSYEMAPYVRKHSGSNTIFLNKAGQLSHFYLTYMDGRVRYDGIMQAGVPGEVSLSVKENIFPDTKSLYEAIDETVNIDRRAKINEYKDKLFAVLGKANAAESDETDGTSWHWEKPFPIQLQIPASESFANIWYSKYDHEYDKPAPNDVRGTTLATGPDNFFYVVDALLSELKTAKIRPYSCDDARSISDIVTGKEIQDALIIEYEQKLLDALGDQPNRSKLPNSSRYLWNSVKVTNNRLNIRWERSCDCKVTLSVVYEANVPDQVFTSDAPEKLFSQIEWILAEVI